jgi:hypothetical protein
MPVRTLCAFALVLVAANGLAAQTASAPIVKPAGSTSAAKPASSVNVAGKILPVDQQVAAAVLPAPAEHRATATVFGYDAKGKLGVVRQGTGILNCLAPDPKNTDFHVACYHKTMEPFMARGRALRESGVKDPQVDTVRFKEVKEGKIAMPMQPAVLYTLTGPWAGFDPATATPAPKTRPLFVVYIPNATGASLGITEKPVVDAPWVMYPGTPKAHIMFVPKM